MDTPLCDAVAKRYEVIFDTPEAMKVRELEEAARNLVRVKGRHHTEQALKRLAEACDMPTPNVKVSGLRASCEGPLDCRVGGAGK